jgi:hypothetical protein
MPVDDQRARPKRPRRNLRKSEPTTGHRWQMATSAVRTGGDQDGEQGAIRAEGGTENQVGYSALAQEKPASVGAVADHGAIVDRDQAVVQMETVL